MPACTICTHPQRRRIDAAIVRDGASVRDVAKRHGVSASALGRHRKNHLAPKLAKAAKREDFTDLASAVGIGNQLSAINQEAHDILQEARSSGDARLALRALDRIERQLMIAAKLADLISDGANVQVAVSVDSGWPVLRSAILETLQDHPAALKAVSDRLAALEQTS